MAKYNSEKIEHLETQILEKKHPGKNSSLCSKRNWKNTMMENRKPRNMNSGKTYWKNEIVLE